MNSLLIDQGAEEDYADSLRWYAKRSQQAADGFEAEYAQALDAIAANPDRFPHCDVRHRFYLMKRYPFQIIYRILPDGTILIMAVAHTSRQPRYWSKR